MTAMPELDELTRDVYGKAAADCSLTELRALRRELRWLSVLAVLADVLHPHRRA